MTRLLLLALVAAILLSSKAFSEEQRSWFTGSYLMIESAGIVSTNIATLNNNEIGSHYRLKGVEDVYSFQNKNVLWGNKCSIYLGFDSCAVNFPNYASSKMEELSIELGLRQIPIINDDNIYGLWEIYYMSKKEANIYNASDNATYRTDLLGLRLVFAGGSRKIK